MDIERKELISVEIDIKKKIFKLNGKDMKGVSGLEIEFNNGKWTLLVTKDEIYTQ